MIVFCLQIFWVFLSLLDAVHGQQNGIQTIFGDPTYSKLRPCAQRCFYIQLGSPVDYLRDVLGSNIGCSMIRTTSITSLQVAENDCFCRTDLQPSAQAVITQCVLSRCNQNENDAATAGAMYNGYCSANGYYAAGGGGRETSAAAPSPTGNTAMPGAAATGGRSSPTGLPGTSSASSVQRTESAALVFCLVSMVSCSHRLDRNLRLRLAIGSYVLTLHLGCSECHLHIVTSEGRTVMKKDTSAETWRWLHTPGGGMSWAKGGRILVRPTWCLRAEGAGLC